MEKIYNGTFHFLSASPLRMAGIRPHNFCRRPLKKKIRIVDFSSAPLKKKSEGFIFWRLLWRRNPNPLVVKPAILKGGGGGVRIKNGTSQHSCNRNNINVFRLLKLSYVNTVVPVTLYIQMTIETGFPVLVISSPFKKVMGEGGAYSRGVLICYFGWRGLRLSGRLLEHRRSFKEICY